MQNEKIIRVSTAQYELQSLKNWDDYATRIEHLVKLAHQDKANLLVLAEYSGLELAGWKKGNLSEQAEHVQTFLDDYLTLFKTLAAKYQIYLQPGTILVREAQNDFRNRAYFFGPTQPVNFQDKLFLTPAERNEHFIQPGNKLTLFDTSLGKIGIMICYDSEFPLIAHQLAAHGAQLILAPSCTETLHGLTRVSVSCRARAIENQCYVVQSSLIGQAPWCSLVARSVGQSGIYTPADMNFPVHGILTQGKMNTDELITADIDLGKIDLVRQHGQVTNFNDMQNHARAQFYPLTTVTV